MPTGGLALEVGDLIGDAPRQRHAPPLDADQIQVPRPVILLNDLRREPRQRPVDPRPVHDACFLDQFH